MLMLKRNNAANGIPFSFILHISVWAHVGHTRCTLIIIVSNDLVNFRRCNKKCCTNTYRQNSCAARICFESNDVCPYSSGICHPRPARLLFLFDYVPIVERNFEHKNAKCLRCVMCFCLIILWLLYGCVDTSNTRSYGN